VLLHARVLLLGERHIPHPEHRHEERRKHCCKQAFICQRQHRNRKSTSKKPFSMGLDSG
jgi:hypothetical protein